MITNLFRVCSQCGKIAGGRVNLCEQCFSDLLSQTADQTSRIRRELIQDARELRRRVPTEVEEMQREFALQRAKVDRWGLRGLTLLAGSTSIGLPCWVIITGPSTEYIHTATALMLFSAVVTVVGFGLLRPHD